jgi:hypothetical protein
LQKFKDERRKKRERRKRKELIIKAGTSTPAHTHTRLGAGVIKTIQSHEKRKIPMEK